MPALFIGVVSHAGSRFSVSQGSDGLAAQLERALTARGVDVTVQVNTDDAHDPATLPVDGPMIKRSFDEQLRLEAEWAAYVRAGQPRSVLRAASDTVVQGLRWIKQTSRFVRPWHGSEVTDSAGARAIRRLLNIELSHFDLLRGGIASGSAWTLILEDDAASLDVDDCASGLLGIFTSRADERAPQYVNVSQSFTNDELGITHLLRDVQDVPWAGAQRRRILQSSRPVTNTVCAIAYRTSFAVRLLAAMEALPMEPVVPIDWKLNVALMAMFEADDLRDGDCWLVEPGPIDQLSMRSPNDA